MSKSIFQQFVEANEALLDCYEGQDPSAWKDKPVSATASVCSTEKNKLRNILSGNEMTMTRVV